MCLSYSSPPKVKTPTRYEENAELSESEEAIASILEQRYFNFNICISGSPATHFLLYNKLYYF